MVVERSVHRRRFFVRKAGEIRSEHADISNVKQFMITKKIIVEKLSPKVQGFLSQVIPLRVSRPLRRR